MSANRNRFVGMEREVSAILRATMARLKISQKSVSEQVGMHPNVLGRKLRGSVPFTAGELHAVAIQLGTTGADVLSKAENQTHGHAASRLEDCEAA